MKMLVSTTPCLSCLCAVQQWGLLFPMVRTEVTCIQPWHSSEVGQGGALAPAGLETPFAIGGWGWGTSAGAAQWQSGWWGSGASEEPEAPAPQPLQEPPSSEAVIRSKGRGFDPKSVSVVLGGSVRFELGEGHNAVEVTRDAYERRGKARKPGGFAVGMGETKTIQFSRPGPHYFVCEPYASAGMKVAVNVFAP